MKIVSLVSAAALFALVSTSCERKKDAPDPDPHAHQPAPQPSSPQPDPGSSTPFALTASTESMQRDLVDQRCVSCHSEATDANRHVDLRDVEELIVGHRDDGHPHDGGTGHARKDLVRPGCPEQSFFFTIMSNGEMPPAPTAHLTVDELEVVRNWILGLWQGPGDPCVSDEPGTDDGGGTDEPGGDGASDEPGD